MYFGKQMVPIILGKENHSDVLDQMVGYIYDWHSLPTLTSVITKPAATLCLGKTSRYFLLWGETIVFANDKFFTAYVISDDQKEAFQLGMRTKCRGDELSEGLEDFQKESHLELCTLFSDLRFIHCAADPQGCLNHWYENHANRSSTYPFASFPEKSGLLIRNNGDELKLMSILIHRI